METITLNIGTLSCPVCNNNPSIKQTCEFCNFKGSIVYLEPLERTIRHIQEAVKRFKRNNQRKEIIKYAEENSGQIDKGYVIDLLRSLEYEDRKAD